MQVFIPHKRDPNPYFDELIKYSKHDFVFDSFKNYLASYRIINIHWPEAIFDWIVPTEEELIFFEKEIKSWKKNAKIIYTKHDEKPHFFESEIYNRLFEIIEKNADGMIHLGNFSLQQKLKIFPKKKHVKIPHPLYESSFKIHQKAKARQLLNINKNALVIIAPGKIRNVRERDLLLTGFNSINKKHKVLISNNMLPFKSEIKFKGRDKLKKWIDIKKHHTSWLCNKYRKPKYFFNYSFTSFEEFSLMLSASDIVFIPRINLLNSGNVFLGLTYGKIVVGPAIGNIKEQLIQLNFPLFNPNSKKSVREAIDRGINLFDQNNFEFDQDLISNYKPIRIASQLDEFFDSLAL